MIQVRGNTFETNSSSAHSLVVTNNPCEHYTPEEAMKELRYSIHRGKYSPWYRGDLTFNRAPFKVLYTFEEKLNYLYANAPIRKGTYYREFHKVDRVVKSFIPDFPGHKFRRDMTPSCESYGLLSTLKREGISQIEFLINKQIIVVCDGDEYCIWSDMQKRGLIDKNNIKMEVGI